MTHDRPLLGILLMFGFCLFAPLSDAAAKLLSNSLPLGQLVFARFFVQALILVPVIALTRRSWRMPRRVLMLAAYRTALQCLGISAMFMGLRYLPLADAVAIAFVMPFIMLLLGKFVLHEDVGMRRLLACVVGFIGTLLVIQPSFAEVGLPALWPLVVAVVFALYMLVTRQIAKAADPLVLQAVSGLMASAVLMPLLWLGSNLHWSELHVVAVQGNTVWMLLLLGALGTVAHLFMTWSLRYAPSSTLASMQYLEIPIAALLGWLVFSDWPNSLATFGICVTMAAGLYVVLRERAILQAAPKNG